MFQKNCYRCSRPSFSSTEEGLWICPNCGADLTAQKSHHPESSKKAGTFTANASTPFLYTYSRTKKN